MIFKQKEIWLVPFPYSDFNKEKKRPVLIISQNEYNKTSKDILVCQITTKFKNNKYSAKVEEIDLEYGSLPYSSEIRCDKINVLSKDLFIRKFSKINCSKYDECFEKISFLLSSGIK